MAHQRRHQFAHGRHLDVAARFYARWLESFRKHHHGSSVWGGDQDVLREMFAAVDFARGDPFCQELDGIKVMFIPCSIYNFSTSYQCEMDGHYPEKKVLHFKGRRKPICFPIGAALSAAARPKKDRQWNSYRILTSSNRSESRRCCRPPGNYFWRAVDSETLDSWTPDLGLTAYPKPSVYRPGAVEHSEAFSTCAIASGRPSRDRPITGVAAMSAS